MPLYKLGPLMVVTICCICWWSRSSTSVGPYIFSHLGRLRTQSPCRSGTIAKHLLSSLEHSHDPAIPGIPGPLQAHCTSLHQGRQEDHGPGVCGDGRGGGRGQRYPHTRTSGSARPPVTSISLWLERFSIMAAILATRFPEKAPEFLAYQASIVRVERNYEGCQWVLYNRQYRREALARRDLNWSVPNTRLYNEAFIGRAWVIPKCSYCLSDDHLAGSCPVNPASMSKWEPCRNFNEGKCKRSSCRYTHVCLSCHEAHPWVDCS